jgi:hypothetical protein
VRWFRTHTRASALAALFALLVQLSLSFGHVHVGHAADHEVALSQNGPSWSEDPPPSPGSHHEDQYCPIYAVLHLIGAAQTATPPAVPLPPSFLSEAPSFVVATIVATAPALAFRSRAPPLA